MKYILFFSVSFILILISGCTETKSLISSQVKAISSFDELSDSTLFSDVRDMEYLSGKLYFTDYKNSQLYITDQNGKLFRKFSQKGSGPEDMNGACNLFIDGSEIYVYNDGSNRFLQIAKSGIVKSISKAGQEYSMLNFIVYNDMLIYTDFSDEGIIACDDMKGEVIERFGEPVKFDSPMKTRIRNNRFVHTDGKRLFLISDCMPLVECYDLSNKRLITQVDLSELSDFAELMAKHSSEESEDNTYYSIIRDTYYMSGKLYILYNDPYAKEYAVNRVLVLDTESKFSPIGVYILPAEIYSSLCVTEDGKHIFAMDKLNSRIEQIEIGK